MALGCATKLLGKERARLATLRARALLAMSLIVHDV